MSSPERLQAIVDRKKRFLVSGQQFAMPRQIKELIYYERIKIFQRNWVYRVLQKLPRIKNGLRLKACITRALRTLPLYREALDFERESNIADFGRKLRQGSKGNTFEANRRYFRKVCITEENVRKERETRSELLYKKSLKKQKYG